LEPKFSLPEAERIYYKDFHFLDEPLFEKQKSKEEARKIKAAAEESKQSKQLIFSNQKDQSN